jgi:hypothetical protein
VTVNPSDFLPIPKLWQKWKVLAGLTAALVGTVTAQSVVR